MLRDTSHESQRMHNRERAYHTRYDPHRHASSLSDIILGGQDGLVNVLGVILGVAVATSDPYLVLVAGLAATFAESVSMAAVVYTSQRAEADIYESERAREYRHIAVVPELERQEIRDLYERKGSRGELLDRIVATITASPDVWVAVMMAEEHQLTPVSRAYALRSALVVGLSAVAGSLIPLFPFMVLARGHQHVDGSGRRCAGPVCRGRLQGAADGWACGQKRVGDGDHRHAQRSSRVRCGSAAQGASDAISGGLGPCGTIHKCQ